MNLVHELWLRLSDLVTPEELHHHDVVHFALNEVKKELTEKRSEELAQRLKAHLSGNKTPHDPA